MTALLEIDNLQTAYGPSQVLFGISLRIDQGGVSTLLGRNGMGKTTTVHAIMGLMPARRGTVEFGGNGAPVLIRISGDYTRDKSDPRNGHRLIPGLVSGAPVLDNVYDTRAGLNKPKQDIEAYGLAMNITAELSDAFTLRSISAWRKDTSYSPIDFDALTADHLLQCIADRLAAAFQLSRLRQQLGHLACQAAAVGHQLLDNVLLGKW